MISPEAPGHGAHVLDPQVAQALAQAPARDAATMTPERARGFLRDRVVDRPVGDDPCNAEDTALTTGQGSIPVRIYRPTVDHRDCLPTIVFFHGGGWVAGDLETHDASARLLCNHVGAVVVSVDYRRAPEAPFPCAVHDCLAAAEWAAAHQDHLGGPDAPLGVAGDSAGGNLAAVVALNWKGARPIQAQLLLYPAVDLRSAYACDGSEGAAAAAYPSRSSHGECGLLSLDMLRWYAHQYLGHPDHGRDERASPLLSGNLKAAPSTVVAVAEHDPLADEGRVFARALEEAGVQVVLLDVRGQTHGFFGMGHFSKGADHAGRVAMDAFAAALLGQRPDASSCHPASASGE